MLLWSIRWEEVQSRETSLSEWGAGTFVCLGLIPKQALEDGLKTILGFSGGFAKGWWAAFGGGGVLTSPMG